MIRVNHAGETGAVVICQGQISGARSAEAQEDLQHMLDQECQHLQYFEELCEQSRARRTLLLPLWKRVGFWAGRSASRCGTGFAMALTEAIEECIYRHYSEQLDTLRQLPCDEFIAEFTARVAQFRSEEREHGNIASARVENDNLVLAIYKFAVYNCCKVAIYLSSRL